MNRQEYSDTYARENESRIAHREFLLQGVEKLTLFHDTFMKVVLNDLEVCQYVIRILMDDPTIEIVDVRNQYRLARLTSKDSILDTLAEDSRGRFYNLEIQRDTTPDHPRRTRLYGAMVDGEYLQKGEDYDAMPEVYVIYISRTDLWKMGRMETLVKKYLEGQREDEQYDDGQHVIYVNAAVDDGSKKAALLHYFKTADPDDMSQGSLSRRVRYLKREEGGLNEMCEYSQRIYNGGKEEGLALGRRQGISEGLQQGRREGISEGLQQGRREGISEGKSEGQLLMKKAMILSMKESGIDEAMIEKILKNVQNNKELQQV